MKLDLDAVKEEDFSKLLEYAKFVAGQVAALQTETTEGKARFKQVVNEREAYKKRAEKLAEHSGVDDDADLDALPKHKDAATEANRQWEVKFKRAERERDEAIAGLDQALKEQREFRIEAEITEALASQPFTNGAKFTMKSHLRSGAAWEDGKVIYKSEDGKVLSLKDGAAGIAVANPDLLQPTGTGGAGVRSGHAGSGGNGKDLSHLSPVERLNAARAAAHQRN